MTIASPRPAMAADEFIAWAMRRSERFELVAGEVTTMAPERLAHARAKGNVYLALRAALGETGCEVLPDGVAVRIDDATVYEPDALVRCGDLLPGDAVAVSDPVIVVEVLSPSTRGRDAGAKLEDYFRLPSVVHYLIVKTESRSVIPHRRACEGVETRFVRQGTLSFDLPGIALALAPLFEGL